MLTFQSDHLIVIISVETLQSYRYCLNCITCRIEIINANQVEEEEETFLRLGQHVNKLWSNGILKHALQEPISRLSKTYREKENNGNPSHFSCH